MKIRIPRPANVSGEARCTFTVFYPRWNEIESLLSGIRCLRYRNDSVGICIAVQTLFDESAIVTPEGRRVPVAWLNAESSFLLPMVQYFVFHQEKFVDRAKSTRRGTAPGY